MSPAPVAAPLPIEYAVGGERTAFVHYVMQTTAIVCGITAVASFFRVPFPALAPLVACLLLALDLLQLAAAVAFLVWLHRAHRNLSLRGIAMQHSSSAAIVMFLIPIANLLVAPLVVADVWSGSAPTARLRRERRLTRAIGAWWAMYVVSTAAYGCALYLLSLDELSRGGAFLVSAACAIGCVLAERSVTLVDDVEARQARLASLAVDPAAELRPRRASDWLDYLLPVSRALEEELGAGDEPAR